MNEDKEIFEASPNDVVDAPSVKEKIKRGAKKHRVVILLSEFSFLFTLILYIVLSLVFKGPFGPYKLNGWALFWIIFLIVPTISQIKGAITLMKLQLIPLGWLIIISYLLIGLLTAKWHPYWMLFLILPLYHLIIVPIKRRFHKL